jgi:hypothetical protein
MKMRQIPQTLKYDDQFKLKYDKYLLWIKKRKIIKNLRTLTEFETELLIGKNTVTLRKNLEFPYPRTSSVGIVKEGELSIEVVKQKEETPKTSQCSGWAFLDLELLVRKTVRKNDKNNFESNDKSERIIMEVQKISKNRRKKFERKKEIERKERYYKFYETKMNLEVEILKCLERDRNMNQGIINIRNDETERELNRIFQVSLGSPEEEKQVKWIEVERFLAEMNIPMFKLEYDQKISSRREIYYAFDLED